MLTLGTANKLKKKFFLKEKLGDNDSLYKDCVKSTDASAIVKAEPVNDSVVLQPRQSSDEARVSDWRGQMTVIEMGELHLDQCPREPSAAAPSNVYRRPCESLQLLKAHSLLWGVLERTFKL